MANGTLAKIDADIQKERGIIAAAQTRLAKLEAAREIVAQYDGDEGYEGHTEERKVSLAGQIETILFEFGPTESSEIFNKMTERGVETTANSVNTTVSRMRAKELIFNEGGKWDLTAKRRRILSR